jgi:hypothetical protein
MKVIRFHALPQHRLASVFANGLLPACSRGKRPEVWVHTSSKRAWARLHTSKRHEVPVGSVVILRLLVDREHLVRRARGVYSCPVVIPPSAIVSVTLPQQPPAVAECV